MADQLSLRLVPDELWELVQPHLPKFRPRLQGGGTAPLPDRQVFTAIAYVLTSGCAWRDLPPSLGVPFQTRTAASPSGQGPGSGPGCTGPCWTSSAARA